MSQENERTGQSGSLENGRTTVRKTLLMGVFWRILIIEAILLVWSLAYRAVADSPAGTELIWYAIRIIVLIAIILLFMMVTLRSFLTRKIIAPLEAIAAANRGLRNDDPAARQVDLAADTPREIQDIVSTRSRMLQTILEVSEQRLRLVNFVKETFGRYLSKKVVDEILESPGGQDIGGHRETVTILMSDLRGFTSLSETRDPEEMVRLLNRYLERMSEIILAYDGIIDEILGDAILAVFGVPEKGDDDALRAVACAVAMQNALKGLNGEIEAEGWPPLEMGIGINTGGVIVGNIGSEVRMKYGIVGAAVNVAARIESNTVGGQVLIGETTHELVRDRVAAERPQTAMMKGLKKPLVFYPITGIGPPYDLKLAAARGEAEGVSMSLPFHCWKVDGKRIAAEPVPGETIRLSENAMTVLLKPLLGPRTDIKLKFDFCLEAHCFDDIYAKVLAVEEQEGRKVNRLRITAIDQKDRDILRKWMAEAS